MQNRNPLTVVALTLVTFGFYGLYWEVKTKGEMNALGADIPTAWLLIVPIANYWWLWKYSQGVEKVTNGKLSGVLAFVLMFVAGFIGAAVIQDSFNNISGVPGQFASAPVAPVAPVAPTPPMPPTPPTSFVQ